MVGTIGNRIYTFNEYGWYRGFIHNYGHLDSVLSIEDIGSNPQEKDLLVYPNPTSGSLHIKTQSYSIEKVVLYDITGKFLKEFKSNEINLANFKSGIYLLNIFTPNSVKTSKIIKN